MSSYCSIAVYDRHPEGALVCPKCEASVERLAAWLEGLDPDARQRHRTSAWIANDSLSWAAEALIKSRS